MAFMAGGRPAQVSAYHPCHCQGPPQLTPAHYTGPNIRAMSSWRDPELWA
jgi:hypothetical protein